MPCLAGPLIVVCTLAFANAHANAQARAGPIPSDSSGSAQTPAAPAPNGPAAQPIVLHKEIPGMGSGKRYIITIADDDRAPLDKLCRKLIAANATCDVMRNPVGSGH